MARDVTNPNCPQVSLLLSAAMNAILGLCMDMDTGKKDIFADTSEASEVQLNAVEFRNYRTQCCSFRGMGLKYEASFQDLKSFQSHLGDPGLLLKTWVLYKLDS